MGRFLGSQIGTIHILGDNTAKEFRMVLFEAVKLFFTPLKMAVV